MKTANFTLTNEQLGNINAAGVGASLTMLGLMSSFRALFPKPPVRVNPVNPALHPDDPADGTAIQGMRLQGGGGGI